MTTEPTAPVPPDANGLRGAERIALWEKRCLFCPIIEGDAPANIIERGERHIAFVPLGPHVPGHVLFVPTEHLPDATVNPERTGAVMAEASRYVSEQGIDANIITSIGTAATQSVPHLHVHVIPRGAEDGLPARWPWIPEPTCTCGDAFANNHWWHFPDCPRAPFDVRPTPGPLAASEAAPTGIHDACEEHANVIADQRNAAIRHGRTPDPDDNHTSDGRCKYPAACASEAAPTAGECPNGCEVVQPYGWVVAAGCPVHEAPLNGCASCGVEKRGHASRYAEGVGLHRWTEPSDALRKRRLLTRRPATPPADDASEGLAKGPLAWCPHCPDEGDDWVGAESILRAHIEHDHPVVVLSEALYAADAEEILGLTDEQLDDVARIVLRLSWLAARESAAATRTGERIARAIEAEASRSSYRDPYAATEAYLEAASIARSDAAPHAGAQPVNWDSPTWGSGVHHGTTDDLGDHGRHSDETEQ